MKFSKYEEKQMRLNSIAVEEAKKEYLDSSISYILVQCREPDSKTNYPEWERWKRTDFYRAETRLKKAIRRLHEAVIKDIAFRDVTMEEHYKEQLPKEYK